MGSYLSHLCSKLNALEERTAQNEKDYMNLYIELRNKTNDIPKIIDAVKENTVSIRNMHLLEEGRSTYTPVRRISHTASNYIN